MGEQDVAGRALVTADGCQLWVRAVGSGPRTVIIPNAVYLERDFAWLAEHRRVVLYDLRGRGRSAPVTDISLLGIERDVADLEAVRSHLEIERAAVLGHSYLGLMVVCYALEQPERVECLIQIGAVPPPGAGIALDLSAEDQQVLTRVREQLALLSTASASERASHSHCEEWWRVFSEMMVTRSELAARVAPGICAHANEHPDTMLAHLRAIQASIEQVAIDLERLRPLSCPVLTIHGRRDRNAPFAGAKWWTNHLPDARLVAVEDAAHVPWLEAPELVRGAIADFLDEI